MKTPSRRKIQKIKPTPKQIKWLQGGLHQPGGKLPLFDATGKLINPRLIQACLNKGWAEHWFCNPLKPDWLVCKLTKEGRDMIIKATQFKVATKQQ